MPVLNEFQQPVGDAVPDWKPRHYPSVELISGRYCSLERLSPRHYRELWDVLKPTGDDLKYWTYLPGSTPSTYEEFVDVIGQRLRTTLFPYVVRLSESGKVVGFLSYLRVDPDMGTIEIGWIQYSPQLQRTPASTEAQYLMMKHAFETLGYRRYEWKCDSLNAPSRNAAKRLGFEYEGTWADAVIYKGRRRDSTWLSVCMKEWPLVNAALETWLSPDNFDANGRQLKKLEDVREALRAEYGIKHSRYDADLAEGGALPIPKWTS